MSPVKTATDTEFSRGQTPIIARDDNLELSIQNCLEGLGISLLSELDVFAFLYRHGVTLGSSDEIAALIGYEPTLVRGVLDRLECNKLIEHSRLSQGAQFFRIPIPKDSGRKRCLQDLTRLLESRCGRLLLAAELRIVRPESRREELSARPGHGKGNRHV